MKSSDFDRPALDALHTDGLGLVEVGQLASAAVVPSCPDWSVAQLIGHASGAHRWVSQVVREGTTPQDRILPEQPESFSDLIAWYYSGLAELESTLNETDPDALIWTPTAGTVGSRWWRRKMAVETAIHRWDAENAVAIVVPGVSTKPLDGAVARAGIVEYLDEFLPGMIALAGENAPEGAVDLEASDFEESWHFRLGQQNGPRSSEASCSVSGSASDLLLWIWN
jgi:uncharacterized protein (TIGR03083 family)